MSRTSEELEAMLEQRMASGVAAQREKLAEEGKFSFARWKMQVWFKSERSIHTNLKFSLSVWESGKRLHGGGDASAMFCRKSDPRSKGPSVAHALMGVGRRPFKKEPTNMGCNSVIPADAVSGHIATCPHCGSVWDTEHIADSIYYELPINKAAEEIAKWFRKLDNSADICAKYWDKDIRVLQQAKEFGVARAQELRGLTIYPQREILKDTAHGKSLESAIKYFLLS